MLPRLLALSGILASGAFACAASGKCLPDVYARQFTLVTGNADAALVQEYALAGCHEIRVDSIVRRSVRVDSTIRINSLAGTSAVVLPSAAMAIYASTSTPKLDSAQGVACAKVRTVRRIDSIPRASYFKTPDGTDLSVETVVPVDPDSVYVCLNGSCSKIVPRVIHNANDPGHCLAGALPPLSAEEALAYLKERLKAASSVTRLMRVPLIRIRLTCQWDTSTAIYFQHTVLDSTAARTMSLLPVTTKETRLSYTNEYTYAPIPPFHDWSDTTISPRLALPSSANAGDFLFAEMLQYNRSKLDGTSSSLPNFRYATGVQTYVYPGSTPSSTCLLTGGGSIWDSVAARSTSIQPIGTAPLPPTLVGDSLRLEGLPLTISTSTDCPIMGIDIQAVKYDQWLFAPSSESSLQKDFFHGANVETANSWPILRDSVLVRGQKISLATLAAFVSTLPRPQAQSTFTVRAVDHLLFVTLSEATDVRVLSADGRILSHADLPAGTSSMELPNAHCGILFVQAGKNVLRLPTP